jgi:predicted nucleic acid-binding protein
MKTLIDVNVVFAIVVERHVHHSTAWRWWETHNPPAAWVSACR